MFALFMSLQVQVVWQAKRLEQTVKALAVALADADKNRQEITALESPIYARATKATSGMILFGSPMQDDGLSEPDGQLAG